jgi:hypothetical protein
MILNVLMAFGVHHGRKMALHPCTDKAMRTLA